MNSKVRIETAGVTGNDTKVFYVAADGIETEISDVVRSITPSFSVGNINTATLEIFAVEGHMSAEIGKVVTVGLAPKRKWNPLRRLREVVGLASTVRFYIR